MNYRDIISLLPDVREDRYVSMMVDAVILDSIPFSIVIAYMYRDAGIDYDRSEKINIEHSGCPSSRLLLAYTILRAKYPMSTMSIIPSTCTIIRDNIPICVFGLLSDQSTLGERVYYAPDLLSSMRRAGFYKGDVDFSRYRFLNSLDKSLLPIAEELLEEDATTFAQKDPNTLDYDIVKNTVRCRVYETYERVLRDLPIRCRTINTKSRMIDCDIDIIHK